jgi:hypothetical protein
MVIPNGVVHFKRLLEVGGGLDTDGNPVPAPTTTEAEMPCRIKAVKLDELGRQNGNTFEQASYEILIDRQRFEATEVELINVDGVNLGTFTVMQVETLEAVGVVKIIV